MTDRKTVSERIELANNRIILALKVLGANTGQLPVPKTEQATLNLVERLADALERLAKTSTPESPAKQDKD